MHLLHTWIIAAQQAGGNGNECIELEFGWRAIGGTAKIVTILRQERTRKGTMLFDHGNGTVQNLKWN